ncbi:MAG: hypothetical protein JNL70_21300 [Saprospiraceae bacterium]|nr:hypothetical protein [Saprospiraceae bacterium]
MIKVINFLLLFTLMSCSSSKIPTKKIEQKAEEIIFSPESATKPVSNNLVMTITPIDAKTIDKESFTAGFRDGNYKQEQIKAAYSNLFSKENDLTKVQKQERNAIKKAIDIVRELEKRSQIPSVVASEMEQRILVGNEVGQDGSEMASLFENSEEYPDILNPYKVDKKYLSVFKISFENIGTEVERLNLKEFQVISGEEQLYPLSNDYFESNWKNQQEKIRNVYRMNMPSELVIAPKEKVVKYISVPAINPNNKILKVNFIRESKVTNFIFNTDYKFIDKTYSLVGFEIRDADSYKYMNQYYYVVDNGKQCFSLEEPFIFISKTIEKPITIYGIGISQNQVIYFGKETVNFRSLSTNKVLIPFQRER